MLAEIAAVRAQRDALPPEDREPLNRLMWGLYVDLGRAALGLPARQQLDLFGGEA